jgi:hypothetical protein
LPNEEDEPLSKKSKKTMMFLANAKTYGYIVLVGRNVKE